MASNIISSTIDDAYPVAGVDNDSQGFRDNFNVIKTNFASAKTEIESLQTNSAATNNANNFLGNDIRNANLYQITHKHADSRASEWETNQDVSWTQGAYKRGKVGAAINLSIKDWPTNTEYAEMVIQLYGDGTATRDVTFISTYGSGIAGTLFTDGNAAWTGARITLPTTTTTSVLIKAFTYDGGTNTFLEFMGTFVAV